MEDWRKRLDLTKAYKESIIDKLPPTEATLCHITKDISMALEQISTKEKVINDQFQTVTGTYSEVRKSKGGCKFLCLLNKFIFTNALWTRTQYFNTLVDFSLL